MYMFPFEKLRVWQQSRILVKEVYALTGEFPKAETFGLVSQLRRAAVSVSSNIAEGSARRSGKDQARFTLFAYSSLIEVINQLMIAVDLGFIKKEEFFEMKSKLMFLSAQINKLRLSQLGSSTKRKT